MSPPSHNWRLGLFAAMAVAGIKRRSASYRSHSQPIVEKDGEPRATARCWSPALLALSATIAICDASQALAGEHESANQNVTSAISSDTIVKGQAQAIYTKADSVLICSRLGKTLFLAGLVSSTHNYHVVKACDPPIGYTEQELRPVGVVSRTPFGQATLLPPRAVAFLQNDYGAKCASSFAQSYAFPTAGTLNRVYVVERLMRPAAFSSSTNCDLGDSPGRGFRSVSSLSIVLATRLPDGRIAAITSPDSKHGSVVLISKFRQLTAEKWPNGIYVIPAQQLEPRLRAAGDNPLARDKKVAELLKQLG